MALLVRGRLKHSTLAPQLPIYVSSESKGFPFDPNTSRLTAADGDAKSVYVDIGVLLPIVEPRFPEDLGELGAQVAGKSLAYFFTEVLPHHPEISPRCVRVIGLEAPVLGELKKLPPRHPKNIELFHASMVRLLSQAIVQAEAQASCLFCSLRFGTQEIVLLLVGAGPYYQIRIVSRQWLLARLPVYTPASFDGFCDAANDAVDEDEEDDKGDKGDHKGDEGDEGDDLDDGAVWTESSEEEEEETHDPRKVQKQQTKRQKNRLAEQNAERQKRAEAAARVARQTQERKKRTEERAAKRDTQEQQYQKARRERPSTDRTLHLFSDAGLDVINRNKYGVDLFESKTAEMYFGNGGDTSWSKVLQLGSALSDTYMEKIQDFIRTATFEDREDARRENVRFADRL
ncbi:hypothetical protein C8F01DRAFT_5902 [Mycena amicta]|nr:hypothetical protein C8F01DRAFT_5902 [Mycena amicta]